MHILTVCFDRAGAYRRLLNVFQASVMQSMPESEITVIEAQPKGLSDRRVDTSRAFDLACEAALKSYVPIAVCDCDLMVLRTLEDVWLFDFDVAVTARDYKHPWNTGIWFMRPTRQAREFIEQWRTWTARMVANQDRWEQEIQDHGGVDQAALDKTLGMQSMEDVRVKVLPCSEWNVCQDGWHKVNDKTRVVHVKSKLRSVIIGGLAVPVGMDYLRPLAKKWRDYERGLV